MFASPIQVLCVRDWLGLAYHMAHAAYIYIYIYTESCSHAPFEVLTRKEALLRRAKVELPAWLHRCGADLQLGQCFVFGTV